MRGSGISRRNFPQSSRLSSRALNRDGVHFPDDFGLREAVGEDPLAVADGFRVVEAGSSTFPDTSDRNSSPAAIA